jgi:molybdopterin-synthase adenylyltransferase
MNRLRIKPFHNPIKLSRDRIQIGSIQYGIASELTDTADGHVWHMLGLLNGDLDQSQIIECMVKFDPEVDVSSYEESLDLIMRSGFVECVDGTTEILSDEEVRRYSRNLNYFSWVDNKFRDSQFYAQEKLKLANVSILGLGGTGSGIAASLVAAGVGSVTCIDFDIVEESNLTRQLIYSSDDIGKSKVEAATKYLKRINPYSNVFGVECKVKSWKDLTQYMKESDLFILCADSPPIEILNWTNEAALLTRTPWMISLYAGPMAVVGTFVPGKTPCHDCLMDYENQKRIDLDNEGKDKLFDASKTNAVIAPSAGLTAQFAALEAIYYICDLNPQTIGRIFHQNLVRYDHSYFITPSFRDTCECKSAVL